jgi:hypothetical protein
LAVTQLTRIAFMAIYPKDDAVKKKVNWDELAKKIKNGIEKNWNNPSHKIDGCILKFKANVTTDTSGGATHTGDNTAEINDEPTPPYRNSTTGGTSGNWSQNSSEWSYAHEAGHLGGLHDDYDPTTGKPLDGHEDHMMGARNKPPADHEYRDLLKANKVECPCECRLQQWDPNFLKLQDLLR